MDTNIGDEDLPGGASHPATVSTLESAAATVASVVSAAASTGGSGSCEAGLGLAILVKSERERMNQVLSVQ